MAASILNKTRWKSYYINFIELTLLNNHHNNYGPKATQQWIIFCSAIYYRSLWKFVNIFSLLEISNACGYTYIDFQGTYLCWSHLAFIYFQVAWNASIKVFMAAQNHLFTVLTQEVSDNWESLYVAAPSGITWLTKQNIYTMCAYVNCFSLMDLPVASFFIHLQSF